ncbi:efflux RND transporter periplasmic adaptor subunit [Occallatibacter riparius]|uniref:Efflux RND transporter periplasmic adaptor subunit n=1 Tax=Occallatibacter riparius TaxID=1002689 RepID=A0A9J7BN22_9BACT|nr:efflux RND transporter periplasmic adaptor subunit [Occallatibacter riparius]UWZ84091.1 efflux RND transporter periplasmic adaptor subunit [Occallatibacter riparius]
MKKILLIVFAILVAAGLVTFMVVRQQSGYTKVLTAKIVKQDLSTVISGTGQIKPKTFAVIGSTAQGRITHLYAKEGDHVKKGQVLAVVENVGQEAQVAGQKAAISAAQTDISSYVAAEKTAQANVEHAQADLQQKKLDYDRAQGLYKAGIMAKQDYDAKKAAYDLDVATLAQAEAGLNQAKANTASARGHLGTQEATLRSYQNALSLTQATAPFDGVVTDEPVREGETVVPGIQNSNGSTFMTVADMSVVTAEVKVDETDIVNVKVGQPADVTVDAIPNRIFKGHVTLVGDQALLRSTGVATSQSTTGTEEAKDFKVVVTLDQPDNSLRPGLSTTARITTAHKAGVLSLPIQALTIKPPDKPAANGNVQAASSSSSSSTGQPDQQGVYVLSKDAHGKLRAHFVPVTTGITGATDIEVLTGLKEGDEIVTGPYKTLRGLKENALIKRDTAKPLTTTPNNS